MPADEAYRVGCFIVSVPFEDIVRVEIFAVHAQEKPEDNVSIKGFGGRHAAGDGSGRGTAEPARDVGRKPVDAVPILKIAAVSPRAPGFSPAGAAQLRTAMAWIEGCLQADYLEFAQIQAPARPA